MPLPLPRLTFARSSSDLEEETASSSTPLAANDAPSSSSSPSAKPSTHLITSSKDTFLKLFNLATQHCIETVVGHRSEAWSFTYDLDSNVLISGGGEGDVKCWKVDNEVLLRGVSLAAEDAESSEKVEVGSSSKAKNLKRAVTPIAALSLPNTSHTPNISQITLHPTLPILTVHSGEKTIDVFRLRTEEELRKKLARRRKREREKKDKKGKGKAAAEEEEEEVKENANGEIEWRDRLAVWSVDRASGKIRSFSLAPETAKTKGDVQVCFPAFFPSFSFPFLTLFPLTGPRRSRQ
jgi:U3 small nucleolar RNA-associated protein 12